ncbi:sensor histidine kinase [Dehalogenimonas etheniformans]|uniref:histidine kinase n=1 Tax=Dehalogenimonas etheniformans TaxID=1536648 RepID=A0A2P5P8V5_9CHLR|nr:HAMP domain-containing sensor histidine kinase [Dehalogenimonas etheniformans]PPD58723.1 sensor histidine kinase [Dehalogenimonas etheniformans]QNT76509.1 HAMP domain-containing histidine kinase [Dehalogenimonas etheniformans]
MDEELNRLKNQNAILEQRVTNLEAYVKQLAHDLKTPLTPLVGASELLASGFNEQPWSDLAQSIKISAENLLRMVDDLLDLELCECGKIRLNLSSFDPVKPVSDEARKIEAGLPAKRVTITLNLPEIPVYVWADETRLRQVISILITSALKVSPVGGRIAVRIARAGSTTVFEIEDDGNGIPESDLLYIFQPYRTPEGQRRRVGNNSLVLAKKLVELQGGSIGAKDIRNQGNTFWFDLPAGKSTVVTEVV